MQPTGSTTTAAAALTPPGVVLELARSWRWRGPDVTATVAEYAARLAYDAGDRSTALLAEGWLAHGLVVVGRGVGAVPRAVAALAEATRTGDVPAIDRLRVSLAAVARSLDDRATARVLLTPVLRRAGAPPAVRADAYLEAVLCGDQREVLGRGDELDSALRAFRQVDGEYAELGLAWTDAALAGRQRALRQPAEAADHARSGLRRILGEQHHPARLRSVSPHLVATLAHELVAALLDLDDVDAAREVASSLPDWDGQPGSLVPTARLRLTLAQRVDLPSGARDEALRAAEWVTGAVARRDLPELEVECHSLVAEIRESGGELSEALAASRRAHAAYRTLTATVERALVLLVRAAGEGPRSDDGDAPAWAFRSPRSGPTNGAGVAWLPPRAAEPSAPSVRHPGSVMPRPPSVDEPPDGGVGRDGLASVMEDPRAGTSDGDRARSLPVGLVDQADGSSPSETTMPDVLSQPTGPGGTATPDAHPEPRSWIAITGPAAMDGPGGSGAFTAAAVSGLFHGQPPPAPPDDSIEAPPELSVSELGVELLNLDPAAEHAPHVIVIDIVTPVPDVSAVRSIVLRAALRVRDQLPRAATLYLLDGQAVIVVMPDTAPRVVTRWVRSVSTGLSLRWSELAPELPRARFRIDVRALDGDRSIAEQLFDLRPGPPDPTPAAAAPPAAAPPAGPADPPEATDPLPPRRARHLAGAARQGPTGTGTVANLIDAKPGSGGRRRRPDVGSIGRTGRNTADSRGSPGAGPAGPGSSELGASQLGPSERGASEPSPYEPSPYEWSPSEPDSGYDTREPYDRSDPRGPGRGQNPLSAPAAPSYDPAIDVARSPSSSGLGAAGPGSVLGAMPGPAGPVARRLPGFSAPFGSSGPSMAGGADPLDIPVHPTGAEHRTGVEHPTGAEHPTAVLLLPGASLDVTTPGLSALKVEPGESDGTPTGARGCDLADSAAHPDPDSGRRPATQRPISELSFAELLAGALAAYRES